MVRRLLGDASVFCFAKRNLVLWLVAVAVAVAVGLMALTANFAIDRLEAGYPGTSRGNQF